MVDSRSGFRRFVTRGLLPLLAFGLSAEVAQALPRDVATTLTNASGNSYGESANELLGQAFQTGSNAARLAFVSANLRSQSGASCTVAVQVRADSNGVPGAVLETLSSMTFSSMADTDYGGLAAGTTTLQPATKYWVVVKHVSGGVVLWSTTYNGASAGTGTLIDDDAYSGDGGVSWDNNVTNEHFRFLVRTEAIPPANPFDRYVWITRAGLADNAGAVDAVGTFARFSNPAGLAVGPTGTVYVVDANNHSIRQIALNGSVTTLAGANGTSGYADGSGSAARFTYPSDIAMAPDGNLYVADQFNDRVRRVTPAGVVSTVAFCGGAVQGIAVAADGTLYVSLNNYTIEKISPVGVVTLLAGQANNPGSADGSGTAARFASPRGLAVDATGNLYVADAGNSTIRKIAPGGVVTTLAGAAGVTGSANGSPALARFDTPWDVAMDGAGNLFVMDLGNTAIRKIAPAGVVSTISGVVGQGGFTDGLGHEVRFSYANGLAVDEAGNLYVGDTESQTVRIGYADPEVCVVTIAGTPGQTGTNNGTGSKARFSTNPFTSVSDRSGNLYVVDGNSHTIRRIDTNGAVSTYAGAPGQSGTNNGSAATARFNLPLGIALDAATNLYISEGVSHTIRKIAPNGIVSTIAGLAGVAGTNDGLGAAARFNTPVEMVVDDSGNLFVADYNNHAIRKIATNGLVTTFAGLAGQSGTNNGIGTAARFGNPSCLSRDGAGNFFVGENINSTVRKITAAGVVTTLAGVAGAAGTNDGAGAAARFAGPVGIEADRAGNLFVSEFPSSRIRKVTPGGVVTTLAIGSTGHVDGPPPFARMSGDVPTLSVGRDGSVILSDRGNFCIRRIYFRQGNLRAASDFDGDRRSDFGVYYPPSGDWYRMLSLAGFKTNAFGFGGTLPITGDWDGDGIADFGCYYPPGGNWYRMLSTAGFKTNAFGFAGTLPIVGDWDGDGKDDFGCYHPPSGNWYRMLSKDGFKTNAFGFAGTTPIVGDWDGDGKDDFGCYYAPGGNWYRMLSKDGFKTNAFGFAGTLPIVGDWDGDGIDDFGCYYPPSGDWFRMMSSKGFKTDSFGFSGTLPIVGDWDGDGKDDFGCYFAPGGNWYRMTSKEGFKTDTFGFSGTLPLP